MADIALLEFCAALALASAEERSARTISIVTLGGRVLLKERFLGWTTVQQLRRRLPTPRFYARGLRYDLVHEERLLQAWDTLDDANVKNDAIITLVLQGSTRWGEPLPLAPNVARELWG